MTNPSQNVGNQRSISSRSYHKNFESAEAIDIGSPSCKGLEISTEQDERASHEQSISEQVRRHVLRWYPSLQPAKRSAQVPELVSASVDKVRESPRQIQRTRPP